MSEIICECGVTYTPKDLYAVKRHRQSAKHVLGVTNSEDNVTEDTFSDLDDEPTEEVVETPKPKRTRKASIKTFADLDKTDAAKAFTADERVSICSSVAATKSAHDTSIEPKVVGESYVAAVLDSTPNFNEAVLSDLQTYVEGVVRIIRAEGNGEKPAEEKPKRTKVAKPEKVEPAPVVARVSPLRTPKIVPLVGAQTKVCRVCGEDKPLDDYRKKSSRPDGRDTICAVCAKAWDEAHKAAKAAAK